MQNWSESLSIIRFINGRSAFDHLVGFTLFTWVKVLHCKKNPPLAQDQTSRLTEKGYFPLDW